MRLHLDLDDELVAALDRRAEQRSRSALIAELIRRGLDDECRWDDIEASLGAISDTGHEWTRIPRTGSGRSEGMTVGGPAEHDAA